MRSTAQGAMMRPPLPEVPAGVVPPAAVSAGMAAGILPFGALRMR